MVLMRLQREYGECKILKPSCHNIINLCVVFWCLTSRVLTSLNLPFSPPKVPPLSSAGTKRRHSTQVVMWWIVHYQHKFLVTTRWLLLKIVLQETTNSALGDCKRKTRQPASLLVLSTQLECLKCIFGQSNSFSTHLCKLPWTINTLWHCFPAPHIQHVVWGADTSPLTAVIFGLFQRK